MGLLELCQRFYNSTDLYEILHIPNTATEKEVNSAYRKLSLKVHPDRVKEDEKLEATEKFKVLSNIHNILSNKNKRARYDETRCVDDEDESILNDWLAYWRMLFKKITIEDIEAYEKEYSGSETEKKDLKAAYLAGKGDMNYIVDQVQFITNEDEPRIRDILMEMIESKEIPAYKIFTHEPARKRNRRHAKQLREAKEAEELKEEMNLKNDSNSLELMIKEKQAKRTQQFDSFVDNLASKYGGKSGGVKRKAGTSEKGTKRKRK